MNKFDIVVRVGEDGALVHVYPFPVSGNSTDDWIKTVKETSKGTDKFFVLRGVNQVGLEKESIKVEKTD